VVVLPIVLYNGQPRWTATTDIAHLIEPAPGKLRDYTPQLRYLLLDEGAIDESAPLALKNLTAALFRLEKSRDSSNLKTTWTSLLDWLREPEQSSLRRALIVWIYRVFVLQAFHKKIQKTRKADQQLAARRYRHMTGD
jgi:hypothetical protein